MEARPHRRSRSLLACVAAVAALLLSFQTGPPASAASTGAISGTIFHSLESRMGPMPPLYAKIEVTDLAGHHVAHTFDDHKNNQQTEANWTVSSLAAGDYLVHFTSLTTERRETGAWADEWWPQAAGTSTATPVRVTAGQTTSGIDWTDAKHAGFITGSVTQYGRVPNDPDRLWVFAYSDGPYRYEAQIGTDGTFKFGGLHAGLYRVVAQGYGDGGLLATWYATSGGTLEEAEATPLAVRNDGTTDIRIAGISGGVIEGDLVDQFGGPPLPLDGRMVLKDANGNEINWRWVDDENNHFRFGAISKPGTYQLEFVSRGNDNYPSQWWDHRWPWQSTTPITITLEQTKSLTVRLQRVAILSGTIRGPGGTPLPETVTPAIASEGPFDGETSFRPHGPGTGTNWSILGKADANGHYEVAAYPGTYLICTESWIYTDGIPPYRDECYNGIHGLDYDTGVDPLTAVELRAGETTTIEFTLGAWEHGPPNPTPIQPTTPGAQKPPPASTSTCRRFTATHRGVKASVRRCIPAVQRWESAAGRRVIRAARRDARRAAKLKWRRLHR